MLSARSQPGPDTAVKTGLNDLSRLLTRLQHQVLTQYPPSSEQDARGDAALRTSVFLRRKAGANVEYARALLLRLEHDVASVKVQSRRTAWTAELRAHRDLVARLNRRLIELDQLDDDDDDDDDASDVDTLPAVVPSPSKPAEMEPALRSRATAAAPQTDGKESGAHSTGLFTGRTRADASLQTREKLLSSQAEEQEAIKSSLVGLAAALKEANVDFGRSLEEEKAVLDRAAQGLDRNALGMEGAERKMGTLRKMTEGQGWYGRIKLYAIIAALWVAAFLLVFVGPKLRF
ncbi:hypothetical protein K461DRAFT_292574 [Myriangium duriaei CBS 260.36]|uniref:Synaptobrevin n=1 Tax=Myriangium duriaei CBS 260.36 TaxID=1168546 RepID=A0A9P4MGP9_9PEZI|nr:hypothetical protein K461DRAFT_292574 [Myriangium duriaei CBS 260.36]